MKLMSVSGYTLYVKDAKKSVEFYKKLGFDVRKEEGNRTTVGMNWFTIVLVQADKEDDAEFQKEAKLEPRGAGVYFSLSVDDVDEFYAGVKKAGLKPSTEPRDWPWGNREFLLRDPDGYKLVLFKKK